MNLCVFQGTFNPIHNAHLDMARYIIENFDFDKILFIPAYKPPHKSFDENMSIHRLNMVKLAVKNELGFEVSDIEFKRENLSYTYLTILELYKIYNLKDRIGFIIGTDAFEKIDTWYEIDKLKNLVKFIIFKREDDFDEAKFDKQKENGYVFEFANMKFEDISSTDIRNALYEKKSASGYIKRVVEDYIKENGLYG